LRNPSIINDDYEDESLIERKKTEIFPFFSIGIENAARQKTFWSRFKFCSDFSHFFLGRGKKTYFVNKIDCFVK